MAIFVRPVREQIEHDRVIRFLQTRWRRRFNVQVNPGEERAASIRLRNSQAYPDLILTPSQAAGKKAKPHAIVEVETGESVNHLEAMAQWVTFSKAKARFYLYVPAAAADTARRLCAAFHVAPSEIWSYLTLGDQFRFTQVARAAAAARPSAAASEKSTRVKSGGQPRRRARVASGGRSAGKTVKTARGAATKRARKTAARRVRPAGRTARPSRAAAARKAPPARKTTGTRSSKAARARKRR